MSLWRQLTRGLRALSHRDSVAKDVRDELEHYMDQASAAFEAQGLSPEEARRAAQRQVGSMTSASEQVRGYGWENIVGNFVADLRFASRRLRTSPGFAAVGVLTLALGIGASTAIFSAVNPILFAPLPYPQARRVVMVSDVGSDGGTIDVTFGTFRELRARSRSFDALAVARPWQPTITGLTEPERLDGQRVSDAYFRVLGILPAIGRDFQTDDDQFRGPKVAILAHGLWQRRFSSDSAVIGRQISLNDAQYTVIGVMPGSFENVVSPSAQVWVPLQYDPSLPPDGREWGHHLKMVGRLRSGVAPEKARLELAAIAKARVPEFTRVPWASLEGGLNVHALQDDLTRGVRPALLAVLGAVALLLIIAGVNVTNLLLARGAQRRPEFAMRAALGAGQQRLMRQLLTESLLLAFLGGALGMVIAQLGVRALVRLSPPGLTRLSAIRVDTTVFLFGLGLTTVIGVIVGLLPSMQASKNDVQTALQQGSRRTSGSHHATRRGLVIAEVALALVLLVSAGLLWRSLNRLFSVEPGFDPSNLLTMQVQTVSRRYDSTAMVRQFYDRALEAVKAIPGVRNAAWVSQLPLSGDFDKYGVLFESISEVKSAEDKSALRYAVTPTYFETMHIPLRKGRLLSTRDVAGAPPVALINESYARRKFPGKDPIGERVHIGPATGPWITIVGVVGDVLHTSLAAGREDAVYTTPEQWFFADNPLSLVVRTAGNASALAPSVRRAIWSIDKDQPIVRVATMEAIVSRTAAQRRFTLILFQTFALVALILAAIGLYGVLAGSVAERTREIGVRAALGASSGEILSLVVRQGMTLTVIGVIIGVAGAAAASRALLTLLFGISPLDLVTYGFVVVLLGAVSALACSVPAWRAARVDPCITLRAE